MKAKCYLSRFFLIYTLFFNTMILNALNYDNDILNIFSKIIPRFIIMSSQKEKVKDTLEICILHDDIDASEALLLMHKINTDYPNGIQNYKINLLKTTYTEIKICENAQLIFMLNSSTNNIRKALNFSNQYNILTMSYDAGLLEDGVEISLFIGRKVLPYINMKAINKNKIQLDNILLRVSKIFYEKEK